MEGSNKADQYSIDVKENGGKIILVFSPSSLSQILKKHFENRQQCFTKLLQLMKMSVQFQKPLVQLELQAEHQRGSRCARAGQESG